MKANDEYFPDEESLKQFSEAVRQLGETMAVQAEQFMAVVQQVGEVIAEAYADPINQLLMMFGPIHRAWQYQWMVKQGWPSWLAWPIAHRMPERWLKPINFLYQELWALYDGSNRLEPKGQEDDPKI